MESVFGRISCSTHPCASGEWKRCRLSERSSAVFGTDFSFADIEQIQTLGIGGVVERRADGRALGRDAFVLEVKTAGAQGAGYTFYAGKDEPVKVLEADPSTLISIDPWWLVLGYTMENVQAETRTELSLSDVFLLETLPEGLFDPERFHSVEP